ncbi:MAG TPA: alpha/beta fold hydrolase [Casimicrobiaceae bacterium]|nr:alpha/beta fold hydrolase [Casimicrobiaceae bacterium]
MNSSSATAAPDRAFVDVDIGGARSRLEFARIDAARVDAPLIVFLHEGLGSVAMWKDYPQTLCAAAGARGLVYSRRGYGCSTPRPSTQKWPVSFLHDEACDVLPRMFERLDVTEPPWLFGHSDGASIALLYASAFPERVAGVVAVAPHVFVEDVSLASIRQARAEYTRSDLRLKLARYHDDPDSAFYGWNDIWLDPAFREWNIEDRLSRIRSPLLAVQGEDDIYGTMAQVDAIARLVPQARVLKLAGCGHSPHRDQPAALTAAAAALVRNGVDGPSRLAARA